MIKALIWGLILGVLIGIAYLVDQNKKKKAPPLGHNGGLVKFNATKSVGDFLRIDEVSRMWYIPDGSMRNTENPRAHSFDDILDFELIEDGGTIAKGGTGRAIAGGILFGAGGAVVGAITGKRKAMCNSMKIKITLNDLAYPMEYIGLINMSTKTDSIIYSSAKKHAQEILSLLQIMCASNIHTVGNDADIEANFDITEEIRKYKKLFDDGIITQDEFEKKKNELLNL